MKIGYAKSFDKAYARHPKGVQEKFKERRNLFLENQFHPLLENHDLNHPYEGHRSINVTGNYRAIFKMITADFAYFIKIDTHPNLYR